MSRISLSEFAGGALQEKFDREFAKVIENMQDPNTPFSKERGITINISFRQNELRDDAKLEISVKSKLASVIPVKTNLAMGKDLKTGEAMVKEYGKQIPGQISLGDIETENTAPKMLQMPRKLGTN